MQEAASEESIVFLKQLIFEVDVFLSDLRKLDLEVCDSDMKVGIIDGLSNIVNLLGRTNGIFNDPHIATPIVLFGMAHGWDVPPFQLYNQICAEYIKSLKLKNELLEKQIHGKTMVNKYELSDNTKRFVNEREPTNGFAVIDNFWSEQDISAICELALNGLIMFGYADIMYDGISFSRLSVDQGFLPLHRIQDNESFCELRNQDTISSNNEDIEHT